MTNFITSTTLNDAPTRHMPISSFNPPQPPRHKRKVAAKPIKTHKEFEAVHMAAEGRLSRYAASRRVDYAKFAPWVARDADPRMARFYNANNTRSRVKLADLLLSHLHAEPAIETGPLYFVTIVSRAFVVPIKDAMLMSSDNIHDLIYRLQQLTRQALHGIPFIGMVEPGLFKGWGPNGPTLYRDSISWHPHALAWGVDRKTIRQARRRLGTRHKSISGGRAFHWKPITFDELDVHGLYMPKAPLKEYRLNPKVGDTYDTETGEIFVGYRQQKRAMRTGDRVRVANAMRHLNLDDLLFGGGDGREMVTAIKQEALRTVVIEEMHEEARRASFALGPQ